MSAAKQPIPPVMSGFLRRTPGGGIAGDMLDTFGFITRIVGTPVQRHGVPGWEISASVIVPSEAKIPFVDDETS